MTEEAAPQSLIQEADQTPSEPPEVTPEHAVFHNLQKLFQGYLLKRPNYEDRYEQEFRDVLVAVWTGMGWRKD